MYINGLLSDELTWELIIRNVECKSSTVDQKRKILRMTIRSEKMDPSIKNTYKRADLDEEEELLICVQKLNELESLCKEFSKQPLSKNLKQLEARVQHTFDRLRYIKISEVNKDRYINLESRCWELLDHLGDIAEGTDILQNDVASFLEDKDKVLSKGKHVTILENPLCNIPGTSHSSPSQIVDHNPLKNKLERQVTDEFIPGIRNLNFSNFDNSSLNRSSCSDLTYIVPVSKWNIKFSGNTQKLGVNEFLERVNELRNARNVSSQQLFNSAVDLFEGQALIWYRAIKHRVSTWNELATLLRSDFLPLDYDEELWSEIRARKQGQDEKPSIFIAVMINLFHRLSSPPEMSQQLKQIIKNLHPYYASHLSLMEVESLDSLSRYCRLLEETKLQNNKFRNPNLASGVTLEPDLAYKPTGKQSIHSLSTNNNSVSCVDKSNFDSRYHRRSSTRANFNNVRCWNCRDLGHTFRYCLKERKTFCFVCGSPGVVYSSCSNCNKTMSKNAERAGPSKANVPDSPS